MSTWDAKQASRAWAPGRAVAERPYVPGGRSRVRRANRAWRPALGSFVVIYVVLGALAWRSYDGGPDAGFVGWYTTIVWTLPSLVTFVGLAGAVMTACRMRRRHLSAAPCRPIPELLIVVVPTIAQTAPVPLPPVVMLPVTVVLTIVRLVASLLIALHSCEAVFEEKVE